MILYFYTGQLFKAQMGAHLDLKILNKVTWKSDGMLQYIVWKSLLRK